MGTFINCLEEAKSQLVSLPSLMRLLWPANLMSEPHTCSVGIIRQISNSVSERRNVFVKPGAATSERRENSFPLPNESSVDEVNADELAHKEAFAFLRMNISQNVVAKKPTNKSICY